MNYKYNMLPVRSKRENRINKHITTDTSVKFQLMITAL